MLSISFQDGNVLVSQIAATDALPTPASKSPQSPPWTRPAWLSQFGNWAGSALREPLVLTWLAAGLAACVLGVAFYRASIDPVATPALAQTDPIPDNRENLNVPPEKIDQALPDQQSEAAPPAEKPKTPSIASTAQAEMNTIPIPPPIPTRPPVAAARPEMPPADLRATAQRGLSQRVLRFEQTVPAVFETLRGELAEVIGVPIRYAEGTEPIMTEVSLTLADATLAKILEQLAGRVGMSYRIDREGILLVPLDQTRQTARDDQAAAATPE